MESRSTKGKPIRVLLADDHTLVREGMAEMLSLDGDIEIVGQAQNGRDAVTLAWRIRPEVVILDVEMPVMGAQATLRRLFEISPRPKVVIVTVLADARTVRELLALGASAYLVKNASMQSLLDTVRSVARGQQGNVIVSVPREALARARKGGSECHLSRRQLEVLRLVASGMKNIEVAEELHVAETTVKRHLADTYKKLGVGSRGEAARKAMSEGWISASEVLKGN